MRSGLGVTEVPPAGRGTVDRGRRCRGRRCAGRRCSAGTEVADTRAGPAALRVVGAIAVGVVAFVIAGWSPGFVGVLAGVLTWLLLDRPARPGAASTGLTAEDEGDCQPQVSARGYGSCAVSHCRRPATENCREAGVRVVTVLLAAGCRSGLCSASAAGGSRDRHDPAAPRTSA